MAIRLSLQEDAETVTVATPILPAAEEPSLRRCGQTVPAADPKL
jgi:hypothetical protein